VKRGSRHGHLLDTGVGRDDEPDPSCSHRSIASRADGGSRRQPGSTGTPPRHHEPSALLHRVEDRSVRNGQVVTQFHDSSSSDAERLTDQAHRVPQPWTPRPSGGVLPCAEEQCVVVDLKTSAAASSHWACPAKAGCDLRSLPFRVLIFPALPCAYSRAFLLSGVVLLRPGEEGSPRNGIQSSSMVIGTRRRSRRPGQAA